MNDAAMLIRMCYADDYPEEARAWRFQWFKDQTLPRILDQWVSDFDLWLWINPKHEAELKAMSPRIQTFTAGSSVPLDSRIKWGMTRGLPKYPIQIRLDSDDLIGPKFVQQARQALSRMRHTRALVWFQPYKLEISTGNVYWCAPGRGARNYSDHKPSAFLALRQPVDDRRYNWVYGLGHTKAHLLADEIASIGEGHCWASCHTYNDSTAVKGNERLIGTFPGFPLPA